MVTKSHGPQSRAERSGAGLRAGGSGMQSQGHLVAVFWWSNLVRLHSLYKILYLKRRLESYSILGTQASPNKILLI